MTIRNLIISILLFITPLAVWAENSLSEEVMQAEAPSPPKHALRFSGQVSAWGQYTPDISPDIWLGGRYIPQLNYKKSFPKNRLLDFEASANLYGELGFNPYNKDHNSGGIKPYRVWGRYSTSQMEIRLGLQKINFGSAALFRPLMWFDRVDPRDPLQLTDGVWGGLFRYYFLNNANLWIWGLCGNDDIKGWEAIPSKKWIPEAGGRTQLPVNQGEIAFSYHFRKADPSIFPTWDTLNSVFENRIGFDAKLNLVVGLWLEGSWTNLNKNLGNLTNQTMLTLGTDYTFGIGNGLATTFEQLLSSGDEKAFAFEQPVTFSGLSLSYPLGIFDNLEAIFYYDWKHAHIYSFLNWRRQFNVLLFYLMAYWNPESYLLPAQGNTNNRFSGKGIQVMVVWNY